MVPPHVAVAVPKDHRPVVVVAARPMLQREVRHLDAFVVGEAGLVEVCDLKKILLIINVQSQRINTNVQAAPDDSYCLPSGA